MRLSNEQLTALDADVLAVSGADPAAATATLVTDDDEFLSLRNPSALSVPWFVVRVIAKALTPRRAAAVPRERGRRRRGP